MIDAKKILVQGLKKTNVPVHYELFIDNKTQLPCISYLEMYNADLALGDNLEYSKINFQVKLWSKDVSEIAILSNKIDKELKILGFRRRSSNELIRDGIIQKIFNYEAIGLENI